MLVLALVRGCVGATDVHWCFHYAGSLSLTLTRDILYSPSPLHPYARTSIVFYDGRFPLHILHPCKSR